MLYPSPSVSFSQFHRPAPPALYGPRDNGAHQGAARVKMAKRLAMAMSKGGDLHRDPRRGVEWVIGRMPDPGGRCQGQ